MSGRGNAAPAPPDTPIVEAFDDTPLYIFGRMMLRPWAAVWFDLKVYHPEHVPRKGGVLVVANHQSYLDPILLAVKIARPFSFLAKSELFENPYFGWLIAGWALTWGAVELGMLQRLLDTVSLSGGQWLVVLALSVITPAFVGVDKAVRLRRLRPLAPAAAHDYNGGDPP